MRQILPLLAGVRFRQGARDRAWTAKPLPYNPPARQRPYSHATGAQRVLLPVRKRTETSRGIKKMSSFSGLMIPEAL
ncbi:MAG: hypothetical protein JWN34_4037 [Bryobacterales bacterium]|nr:hypothetical protein [Bryobacterales bacterium]